MKIRNKLLISTSTSVALMIILGYMVYTTSQEINKSVARRTLSQNIITDVFDLNILRSEYALNSEERPKIQWFSKYESLGNNIKKAEEEEEEEEWSAILINIGLNYNELKPLFSEFVNYTETPDSRTQEYGGRLRGQMLVNSQEIVSLSKRLNSIAAIRVQSAAQRMFIVVIAVIAVGILIAINFISIFRVIIKPIHQLHKATEELEKGNFNVRVDIKTKDELGQLGKSFNNMAMALGNLDEERKQLDKSKIQFLSITSHELRSPMTPMKAQLQMALQGYFGKLNKKQKEALGIVLNNTERLDKLILDLLDISRIEAAKLKFSFVKIDLMPHIKKLVEEMKSYLPEKNITIISKIVRLPVTEADPDRVSQVLRNLVDNAIKFSKENEKVIVTAEHKGSEILFSVKDFGIGIAKENQASIFMPFFQEEQTISREYGGTGLGLAICKGIVEAQGGKIWFESEKDKGSTFYFTVSIKPVKVKYNIGHK